MTEAELKELAALTHGKVGGGGTSDRSRALLEKMEERFEKSAERKTDWINDYEANTEYQDGLAKLGFATSLSDGMATGQYIDTLDSYQDAEIPTFADPLVSQAAQAKADPEAVKAQKGLLDKILALTDVGPSAQERFQAEKYRQDEEMSSRGAREAILADMRARGTAGGGAELASLFDSQSNTARNRLLSDLALQAQAQQRSQDMIGKGADLSSTIRDQSFKEDFNTRAATDAFSQFNALQDDQRKKWIHDTKRTRENDRMERAGSKLTAFTDQTGRVYDRGKDTLGAKQDHIDKVLGARITSEGQDAQNETGVLSTMYGYEELEKAGKTPKKNGLLGLGIGPL